jgi:hypothetical protein
LGRIFGTKFQMLLTSKGVILVLREKKLLVIKHIINYFSKKQLPNTLAGFDPATRKL